ncbi:unnamed protein product [Adineta steineri]|uniref:Uncharacterized protein n=1 Tax=Adineta steineri TaxID=433720 RepID=A0A813TYY5_9BILA|nr:unnamed protein product [Adineta steineri]
MIVNELMIEEWMTNISYDKYFKQCAPNLYTYTKNEKYSFTFILTKIISLLGGFTLVLGFIIQLIVRFIRRLPRTEPITCILSVYILIDEGIHRITVLKPTENQYKHFQQIYSNKSICPCSSITMTYANFITIQPYYHQVCSSDLVSARWIQYNTDTIQGVVYLYTDYRINSELQFQQLAMFCQ